MKQLKNTIFILLVVLSIPGMIFISVKAAQCLEMWFNGELSSWVQSIGTIIAIVSGFGVAAWQNFSQSLNKRKEECVLAKTAHDLAHNAIDVVSDRLNNSLNKPKIANRQKDRATEIIQVMKEFQIVHVPAKMRKNFVEIRVQLVAINGGVNDSRPQKRRSKSHIRVYMSTIKSLDELNEVAKDFDLDPQYIPADKFLSLMRCPELEKALRKVNGKFIFSMNDGLATATRDEVEKALAKERREDE